MKQPLPATLALFFLLFYATATVGQTPGEASLKSGLITWLQCDETSGKRALDASGSGKSTSIENGTATPVTGHTPGQRGLELGGTKPVRIPLAWQPTRFTVSWWVAPRTRDQWTQTVTANGWGSFLFHTSPDGTIYVGTDLTNRIVTPAAL